MSSSQEVALRIKSYAKIKKTSVRLLLEKCALGQNTISKMSSNGTDILSQNLLKIADYLDCSVDYLLGRTDTPKVEIESKELSNKEKLLVYAYRDKKEYQNSIDKMLDIIDDTEKSEYNFDFFNSLSDDIIKTVEILDKKNTVKMEKDTK